MSDYTSSREILERIRGTSKPHGVTTVMLQRRVAKTIHGQRGQFAKDIEGVHLAAKQRGFVHPADTELARRARAEAEREDRDRTRDGNGTTKAELSPADLVWLQRLPHDPADVSHNDAARIAGLAARATHFSPSSRALVESIWRPIEHVHNLAEARHQLAQASQAGPAIPHSAHGALIEALTEEHRDWPETAIRVHASELLRDAIAERDDAIDSARASAQSKVDDLVAVDADRSVTSRPGAA